MRVLGPFAAILFLAGQARAQEWVKDKRFSEGQGLTAGDLQFHPSIAGEIGYDSNWFLRSDKNDPRYVNSAPAAPVRDGGVLRITPSLTVATLPSQRNAPVEARAPIDFRGGLAASYYEFIGNQELRDQRNLSGHADLRMDILPQRPWAAAIFGQYDRTLQPNAVGNPDLSFNRDTVLAGGELIAQPNSGTLDYRLGYTAAFALFETTEGRPFDNLSHEVSLRGRWRFRPRTAFIYDGTMRFASYYRANTANTLLHDSTPVRTRIGLTGLVTPRVAVMVIGGWGASFFRGGAPPDNPQQYDSVIGQAEIRFYPTGNPTAGDMPDTSLALSSIAIGYNRDFQISYLGDFYGSDRGYAKIAYFFGPKVVLSLEGGVGAIEYPRIFFNDPARTQVPGTPFTDIRVDGTLFGEYRILDTVGINATFKYAQNISNTALPQAAVTGGGPGPAPVATLYDMSWRRFQAFLGVRWFM
jgi:hypothetical protein